MDIGNVGLADGRAIANLIQFLGIARADLSGKEMDQLVVTKRWLHDLAVQAARQLETSKATPSPAADSPASFRITRQGRIGESASGGKRSRSKKK